MWVKSQVCINLSGRFPPHTTLVLSRSLSYTCYNVLNFVIHIIDTKLHCAALSLARILTIWYSSPLSLMSHPSERFIGLSSCMFAFALAHNKWMANPKNSRFSQPPHTHRRKTLFRRRQTTAVAHKKCREREDEQLENVECRPELSETGNTIKSIAAHQIEPAPVCALEWGEKRDEEMSQAGRESRGHWTQQTRRKKKWQKCLIEDNYVMYHVFAIPSIC